MLLLIITIIVIMIINHNNSSCVERAGRTRVQNSWGGPAISSATCMSTLHLKQRTTFETGMGQPSNFSEVLKCRLLK